jgi:FMN phosphatase YigB (HAD superfamily)
VDHRAAFDVDFVFFDLDDTLLDHRHAERLALSDLRAELPCLSRIDPDTFERVYHEVNVAVWKEYGAGQLDKAQAKRARFDRLFDRLRIVGPDGQEVGDRYLEVYSRHWRARPGALEAWSRIADRVPVGVMTNGFREIQEAKLLRFPEIADRSAATVISEVVGFMKPDPRIFEWAATSVGVAPGRILYVGDSLHSDIRGGHAAGWQVAWIDGDPARAPDGAVCFSDWSDLASRV